jgi:ribosomal protein S18 acetylase RimI-like enzyme
MNAAASWLPMRTAVPADVEALVAVENAVFETDRISRRSFLHFIASPSAELLVAHRAKGGIAGYTLVLYRRSTSVARLYSIAVVADMRGSGLGEALMAAAEEAARQHGELFMRLEVRPDNAHAIALYERRGYKLFGRCLDYYEDHADALRLEKSLIGHAPSTARNVPYYAQTSDFTCGPAAAMMALAATGETEPFSRRLEFRLWREATSIYLISAPGGCDPLGLALALARRGRQVEVHVNQSGPFFTEGMRNEAKREIMMEVQADYRHEIKAAGIPVIATALGIDDLIAALDRGAAVIVLISTYRMYRERVPHWIVVYDHDQRYIFAHDPFVDPDEHEVPLGKAGLAIPMDEFDSIAAYGRSRLRAAIIVKAIPAV